MTTSGSMPVPPVTLGPYLSRLFHTHDPHSCRKHQRAIILRLECALHIARCSSGSWLGDINEDLNYSENVMGYSDTLEDGGILFF